MEHYTSEGTQLPPHHFKTADETVWYGKAQYNLIQDLKKKWMEESTKRPSLKEMFLSKG